MNIGNLIVQTIDRSRLCIDGEIDTGENNGSGEIIVRATGATPITARSFQFTGVTVETSGDYAIWSEDNLKDEAAQMLARDYTEEVDED